MWLGAVGGGWGSLEVVGGGWGQFRNQGGACFVGLSSPALPSPAPPFSLLQNPIKAIVPHRGRPPFSDLHPLPPPSLFPPPCRRDVCHRGHPLPQSIGPRALPRPAEGRAAWSGVLRPAPLCAHQHCGGAGGGATQVTVGGGGGSDEGGGGAPTPPTLWYYLAPGCPSRPLPLTHAA